MRHNLRRLEGQLKVIVGYPRSLRLGYVRPITEVIVVVVTMSSEVISLGI